MTHTLAEMRQRADAIEERATIEAIAVGIPWRLAESAVVAAIMKRGKGPPFTPDDAARVIQAMKNTTHT